MLDLSHKGHSQTQSEPQQRAVLPTAPSPLLGSWAVHVGPLCPGPLPHGTPTAPFPSSAAGKCPVGYKQCEGQAAALLGDSLPG